MGKSEFFKFNNFVIENKPMDYSGIMKQYQIVRRNPCVIIVPLCYDSFILVNEFRPAIEKNILQFPAGKIEFGEEPIDSAIRELEEETGYIADRISKIGEFYTAPHFSDELIHVFSAECKQMTKSSHTDREKIVVEKIKCNEFPTLFNKNSLLDAKTLTAYSIWRMEHYGKI